MLNCPNKYDEPVLDETDLVLLKPVSYTQVRDLAARLHPAWKRG